jgi:hypothetical protein
MYYANLLRTLILAVICNVGIESPSYNTKRSHACITVHFTSLVTSIHRVYYYRVGERCIFIAYKASILWAIP